MNKDGNPNGNVQLADIDIKPLVRGFDAFNLAVALDQITGPLEANVQDESSRLLNEFSEDKLRDPHERARLQFELTRLCIQGQLHPVLTGIGVPYPTYNYLRSYEANRHGPWSSMPLDWLYTTPARWSVLGFNVGFPFGVPASVISTSSGWIAYYARQGYNILTYKTVRSEKRVAHPSPNWVFLKGPNYPLPEDIPSSGVEGDIDVWPADPEAFSMANSFGVPSEDPSEWKQDVAKALASLRSEQLLIVSVMGNQETLKAQELIEDFVLVAKEAEDAGARVIELNLSCPNSVNPLTGKVIETLLCDEHDFTVKVVRHIRRALQKDTKLVIKLGYMERPKLERLVKDLTLVKDRLIDGISGINTVQMNVTKRKLTPAFLGIQSDPSKPRARAGVSGIAIREYGLQFVRALSSIREDLRNQHGVDFDIIGMGGVMNVRDAEAYFRAGAQAVQSATASFFRPTLAQEVLDHFLKGNFGPTVQSLQEVINRGPLSDQDFASEISHAWLGIISQLRPTKGALIDMMAQALYNEESWFLQRMSIRLNTIPNIGTQLGRPDVTDTVGVSMIRTVTEERDPSEMSVHELLKALDKKLGIGRRWIAYLATMDSATVSRLADGVAIDVEEDATKRLRVAYEIGDLLTREQKVPFTLKGKHVDLETWFIAANPLLDDDAPVHAIRHDRFREVYEAAHALTGDGYRS